MFSFEKQDQVLLGALTGQVNSSNAADLEIKMLALVDEGEHDWVLDLARLDYISSAGLRVVLMLAKRLREKKGSLVLCRLQPHVREVFDISGFLAILNVVENKETAIDFSKKK